MSEFSSAYWVDKLQLSSHPEGGYYQEFYRSDLQIRADGFEGMRSVATGIYFLLLEGQFSALHRIKSDEIWHFYEGGPLEIVEIDLDGQLKTTLLGRNLENGESLTYVVPAGHWFGSRSAKGSEYSLVTCVVSPGFDFADFEMPDASFFLKSYPDLEEIILAMTRNS
jgi:predicted cupin superfamily sugar epimerase